MPQMRMKVSAPVNARNRTTGELIQVDHRTGKALAQLKIAEYVPQIPTASGLVASGLEAQASEETMTSESWDAVPIKRAIVKAEAIDKPRKRKRGYLRVGQ
jgi:hypothetical protein